VSTVLALARNTFRESVRDRILVSVLAFGAIFVVASVLIAPLTLGEHQRVVRDLGLASISFFTLLLVVLLGTTMVRREVDSRTIDTILTHPVGRPAFILGKFAGFYATVLLCLAMLSVIWLLVVAVFGGGLNGAILWTPVLAAMEALVVTSVAILFSTVASPLLSAVFTFLVFVAGHVAHDVKKLADLSESEAIGRVTDVIYAVLPSLHHFDTRNSLLSGLPVPAEQVAGCGQYAVLYSAALVALTIFAFSRRDFE